MKIALLLSLLCLASTCQAITYDSWIASYGLSGSDAVATADPDGDGFPNLVEYSLHGMTPNARDRANHASLPVMSFVRRTGAAMGAWEWTGVSTPPTNGLSGKWHYAIRFVARAGVEGIRYVPQCSTNLTHWHDGRSAIWCESYPGSVIQATARTLGNRYTRSFMRLLVRADGHVGNSLAGIQLAAMAPQALITTTPVAVPRAITSASSSSLTVEDRQITRTTGATTVTDYVWSWTPAPTNVNPVVLTRESSDTAVIIPDASDPYRWTFVGNGTATIRLRTGSSSYTAVVTTSTATGATTDVVTGYVAGSLRAHIATAIDGQIAGKTPSAALPIYSTQDHVTPSYVRNTGCWGATYASALTALSPWNSVGGNQYAGVLISPRHVLCATHWSVPVGATIRFVASDGTVVTRTISSILALTATQSLFPDLLVAKLDSDVPGTIAFARVLPSDWAAKLPSLASYPVVCAATDQEEKLLVREVTAIPTSTSYALTTFRSPADATRRSFYEDVVGGDSSNPAFLVINGQIVLLTCWTYGGSGSGTSVYAFKAQLNAAMTTLGGGYTLTDADLSSFTSF